MITVEKGNFVGKI